jgi:hypothetical protein
LRPILHFIFIFLNVPIYQNTTTRLVLSHLDGTRLG